MKKINPLNYEIKIQKKNTLFIYMQTPRLAIRSVKREDEGDFQKLLTDPVLMEKYSTGNTYTNDEIKSRINLWTERSKNHNPFNVYTILHKGTKEFMGFISISPERPGESQTSYIIHKHLQGYGYGREAISAMVYGLVPKLMCANYHIKHESIKKMTATARIDNKISRKMLEGAGFQITKQLHRDGHPIYAFELSAKKVRNESQRFFHRKDIEKHQREYEFLINQSVSVSAEEMANSSFGCGRNH